MFRLIGLGEQAGSGIPKIYTGWQSQHKRIPVIEEQYELEQTIMTLYV
jgi:predicted HTH transcriptional regulator